VNDKRSTDAGRITEISRAGMAAGRIPVGIATRGNNPPFTFRRPETGHSVVIRRVSKCNAGNSVRLVLKPD
jgi:hypothetical protein